MWSLTTGPIWWWRMTTLILLLLALATPVQGGYLKSLSTSSSSLITGATSVDLTFSFTTNTTLPTDGKIVMTLPSPYTLTSGTWSNAFTSLSGSLDGSFTVSASSQTITIARSGTNSAVSGLINLVVSCERQDNRRESPSAEWGQRVGVYYSKCAFPSTPLLMAWKEAAHAHLDFSVNMGAFS